MIKYTYDKNDLHKDKITHKTSQFSCHAYSSHVKSLNQRDATQDVFHII